MRKLLLLLAFAGFAFAQSPAPRDLQLFLLIGQSNMAGRGPIEPQDKEVIPGILSLNKQMEWVPAIDPLHSDKPEIAAVGIGRTFAKTLLAVNPTATIGLIPCAFGGTSLEQWKKGGALYEDAVKRARFAMKSGRLRGILWHQGEADSGTAKLANSYGERFKEFITLLRQDLDAADTPVMVGQLGEFFGKKPGAEPTFADVVNQQIALIPLQVPRTGFVSSAGLTDKGDQVHFNTASFREFGRRYAHAFLSLDPTWDHQMGAIRASPASAR
ncbi:MAG: sialate O-acetylesterase [Bryobacteraceae bacterium]